MNKTEFAALLASGTPKQKALLVIEDNMKDEMGKPLLTSAERKKIEGSFTSESEKREYWKYLSIAEKYEDIRFRIYALEQNIKMLLAKITALCYIWEMSDHYADFCNNTLTQVKLLLGDLQAAGCVPNEDTVSRSKALHLDNLAISDRIDEIIYENGKYFTNGVTIEKGKDGRMGANIDNLREDIDTIAENLALSLGLAKAFSQASDQFTADNNSEAFIPEDVKNMLSFFKNPYKGIPERYLESHYDEVARRSGADSFEAKAARKYAILPSYGKVKAIGVSDLLKNIFNLKK